jgi:2,3-bisphosphoglycerate-independent phosphoglycerate mutase
MLDDDSGAPFTAHTTSQVPLIVTVAGASLRPGGELSDLVPTAIALLNLRKPLAMTGVSVIQ